MGLAQGHKAVTPVRLEPVAPWSEVKLSTTEPLCSHLLFELALCKTWNGPNLVLLACVNYLTVLHIMLCLLNKQIVCLLNKQIVTFSKTSNRQTWQTQIRLLLKKQSDLGLSCLLF